MKTFTAVALGLLVSAGASAQRRAPAAMPPPISIRAAAPPVQVHSAGALGGSFASIGISRPLGGIAPSPLQPQRHRPAHSASRYIGPIYYVPSYSDLGYSSYGYGYPMGYSTFNTPANPALYYTPPLEPQGSAAPVIINQYFGSRKITTQTENGGSSTTESDSANPAANPTSNPGDPIGQPQNYYLIAYKDHSIYSALAYWLEGDTLHYVTTQNTHNQASLALIDLDQTFKLNAGNNVPFSLSGK